MLIIGYVKLGWLRNNLVSVVSHTSTAEVHAVFRHFCCAVV